MNLTQVVILVFLSLGQNLSSCQGNNFIHDEGNAARKFVDAITGMQTAFESPELQDLLKLEMSESVETSGMDITEIQLARMIVQNKDVIFSQIEGKLLKTCLDDLDRYYSDLTEAKLYAWQMRTANGEFGGLTVPLFTLRYEYPGIYELCDNVNKRFPAAPFGAIYCTEHLPFIQGFYLEKGRCCPATCSNNDLNIFYNGVYAALRLNFWAGDIYYTCIRDVPWEWDAIFVACLLGAFVLIVAAGTFYDVAYRRRRLSVTESAPIELENKTQHDMKSKEDVHIENEGKAENIENHDVITKHQSKQQLYMTKEEEKELEQDDAERGTVTSDKNSDGYRGRMDILATSCSAAYTSNKILSAKKSSSSLGALNGIRVISMFWIIWGHANSFLMYERLDNPLALIERSTAYWYNATLNGTYAVDSFFVLSGLLVTYLTLKEMNARNGKLNWFMFYFHRFWRLTPAYMMTLAVFTTLAVHMGKGADKFEADQYNSALCKEYWWANLLYINNLYPFPGIVGGCMGWSWYVANDMQFYVISPLFLILLANRKTRKIGLIVVGALLLASCIVTATLTGYYGLPVAKTNQYYNKRLEELEPHGKDSDIIYGKPYCRIQSYMVGVLAGYILYRHFFVKKVKIHRMENLVAWVFAVGIMYTLLYAMHPTAERTEPLPQWFVCIWAGVCRACWSLGVAWVAFACSTGHGGLINSFLSMNFWTPLARLTYGAYLLHPIIMVLFIYTKKISFHWTYFEMIYFSSASITLSYVAALLLSVLVEGPAMGLEKAILRRKK
ncbi:O-acyltransferase like protein-like [Apostichopus japonicus]|uniref:O-acyltransferase like protein-like n=1 Tax=Stichopus japonicus TaxID=307972 RepID=UPI003AB30379